MLSRFQPATRGWFEETFGQPTAAQGSTWPLLWEGKSTLLLAPTGSGKTLAAFLVAIDRAMFGAEPPKKGRCRTLYVSPIKALGADVERNLEQPISGIARVAARMGAPHRAPTVFVRSGDTAASARAKMARTPPDILITTPESLYLILTSEAREILAFVDTVIVDEIHAIAATKRGAHLFVSLERLEALRRRRGQTGPLQRIGLSATQRPLHEVARLLGGGAVDGATWNSRPVEIVDAGAKKAWDLSVVVPPPLPIPPGPKEASPAPSVWPAMFPVLVEQIRRHRSTMIFANSRRLAERIATAINEHAEEELALAHHGSLAHAMRKEIEERLKRGELKAIVATSSLELGIDIGAVDLVLQIESPPSIAAGLQRIGRAGHQVGAVSRGILFPKYKGDLLACAAAVHGMQQGLVEETFYPRNALDVLAQQIVATVAMDPMRDADLFDLLRGAAPYAELPRSAFEGVLDMLSGKYPSDDFADLRPRVTWDRTTGLLRARETAKRIAVANGGTIADRGLYGVFFEQGGGKSRRVGELDEEMVFESKPGDVVLLGATSWRITEIDRDRVLVVPAPGEPGRLPFWHGDRPGRPLALGEQVGALARTIAALPAPKAIDRLQKGHGLNERAAADLVEHLREQKAATGIVPSDTAVVVERFSDQIGSLCVAVLTPFGARVHAPWSTAVLAKLAEQGLSAETLWTDDGIVFRMPEADKPPPPEVFVPSEAEAEQAITRHVATTSLFSARFRENAGRALLLPRRRPGHRTPLWAQRKRAGDLLAVAANYPSFPILLETYRECLRDTFDVPGLVRVLGQMATGKIRVVPVDSRLPSPFAAQLMFSYVGTFLYDGDQPLAERRAQALLVDTDRLRALLGETELRDLLDKDAILETERDLQHLSTRRQASSADALHDLLLSIGDLSLEEAAQRALPGLDVAEWTGTLLKEGRIFSFAPPRAATGRIAAIEDAARLRDGLGIAVDPQIPAPFLVPVADPIGDLVSRYARTHGPFSEEAIAARFGLPIAAIREVIRRFVASGKLITGEMWPGRRGREVCDAEVLRTIKRKSLAILRREAEPVDPAVFARFLSTWHGVVHPRSGPDALLAAIERLQGAVLPLSVWESEVLPRRVADYRGSDLDMLCAAGEVVWIGIEKLGQRDGRIALFLADQAPLLAPPPRPIAGPLAETLASIFARRGALFFSDLVAETGSFANDVAAALWDLLWAGRVTNDTFAPLRSLAHPKDDKRAERRDLFRPSALFRSRRTGPPGTEGRWSIVNPPVGPSKSAPSDTEKAKARVAALLHRHGVLTRETVTFEGYPGGFAAAYPVLKMMEEAGHLRRGYFVAGAGATQFALPGAEDQLRTFREPPKELEIVWLSATDPANPYGSAFPWPELAASRMERAAGAQVILIQGEPAAFIGRTEKSLTTNLPAAEPERSHAARTLASSLAHLVDSGARPTWLFAEIDGDRPETSPMTPYLVEAGFVVTQKGIFLRGTKKRLR